MKGAMKGVGGLTLDKFLQDLHAFSEPFQAVKLNVTTLYNRHLHLAEHHLYGSSRLGIKKYLPNHYDYTWTSANTNQFSIDSSSIGFRQPWYSYALNEFVSPIHTEYSNFVHINQHPWLSNRIIGMKHYELTNHLGNVQATILDKYTPRQKQASDPAYNLWHANLSTATDHYPFGSPMPGRSTTDTVTQSFTATTPFSGVSTLMIDDVAANTSHFTWGAYGPPSVLSFATTPTTQVKNNLGCPAYPIGYIDYYGIDLKVENLVPGKDYKLYIKYKATFGEHFKFEEKIPNAPYSPIVLQSTSSNNSSAVLGHSFTANASGVHYFQLVYRHQCNYVSIDSIALTTDTTLSGYITTLLTDKQDREDYRFGFNGQEKDNEIKGVGNSYSFLYRIFDSRLGKFLSVDPLAKSFPHFSSYQFAGNSPISAIDVEGAEPLDFMDNWVEKQGSGGTYSSTLSYREIYDKVTEQSWIVFKDVSGGTESYSFYGKSDGQSMASTFDRDRAVAKKTGNWKGSMVSFKTADAQANDGRMNGVNGLNQAFQTAFQGVGLIFAAPVAGYGIGAKSLALGGGDLVGQLATNEWNIKGVNLTSVFANGTIGNPALSEFTGSSFKFTLNEGFSKSATFGSMNANELMTNTAIGGTVGTVMGGVNTHVSTSGGTLSLMSARKDLLIMGKGSAKTTIGLGNAVNNAISSGVSNTVQNKITNE